MTCRVVVLTAGFTAATALTTLSAAPGLRQQIGGRYGQQSRSASAGRASPSVIASWQAHGADDFVGQNTPSNRSLPPIPTDQDWILDLMVLWRWHGQAPDLRQSSVGDEVGGSRNVHRVMAGDRELRVQFDPQAGTAQIGNGPLIQLKGVNVLMLDVSERDVRVAGIAMVDPRYPPDPAHDPIDVVITRSPEVAAFVNRPR
jgi:hypothetical protein